MVFEGYAVAYRRYSNAYASQEAEARAAKDLGRPLSDALGLAQGALTPRDQYRVSQERLDLKCRSQFRRLAPAKRVLIIPNGTIFELERRSVRPETERRKMQLC